MRYLWIVEIEMKKGQWGPIANGSYLSRSEARLYVDHCKRHSHFDDKFRIVRYYPKEK